MKNRFIGLSLSIIFLVVNNFFVVPLFAQACDNTNPYFEFVYTGPNTIIVDGTCMGTLDWPITTPTVDCKPTFTCTINLFQFDAGLTGHNRGDQIRSGNTVDVFYLFEGTANPGNILVKDTFCFSITFIEIQGPTFPGAPPANLQLNCAYAVPPAMPLLAQDDCDLSFPKMIDPVDIGVVTLCTGGTINRSWTVTDSSGNMTIFNQAIIVIPDTIAPVIGTAPTSETAPCETADYLGWITTQRNIIQMNSTDNCGIASISDDAPAEFPGKCGTVDVTFFVTDSCGLTALAMASYTITDNISPVFTGIDNSNDTLYIDCNIPVPAPPMVTATDNCTDPLMVNFTENSTQTSDSTCSDYRYEISRLWTTTDSCGNMASTMQMIFVIDTLSPSYIAPTDTIINCTENTNPGITGEPTMVMDNCDVVPAVSFRDVLVDTLTCPFSIVITREWRAQDACGNTTIRLQTITVQDTMPPTFVVPADITIDCSIAGDLDVEGRPTMVMDNCDPDPLVTMSDVTTTLSCVFEYQIERTWTVEDTCGNQTSKVQIINVADNINPVISAPAQDMIVQCDTSLSVDDVFNNWIIANGNATASDNCTDDTFLVWIARNSGTSDPANLPSLVCPSPYPGILRMQTVDFIVIDACGNRDTTTANFSVIDDTPPTLLSCPINMIVNNDPGNCSANLLMMAPQITDDCNNTQVDLNYEATQNITSNGPFGDRNIPVNPINIGFNVAGPPAVVNGDFEIEILLVNIDGESNTEFFNIFAEGGYPLGQTNMAISQCDTSITTIVISDMALANNWISDGVFSLNLEPNVPVGLPGSFAVNNICPDARVIASVNYKTITPDVVTFDYSVNDGVRQSINPIGPFNHVFDVGLNDVKYYVTDCAGNVDSCFFTVEVLDTEPPMLNCPTDVVENVDPGTCSTSITLPLPVGASDNCGLPGGFSQTMPTDTNEQLLTFFLDPDLNDYLANNKTITFNGITGNAFGAAATLTINLLGDFDEPDEFFSIIGENGFMMGTTEVGQPHVIAGDCMNPGTATFSIPPDSLNSWASDGDITIRLISNLNVPLPPGLSPGINPCDPGAVTMNGQNDGISRVWATIEFNQVEPTYYSTGVTIIPPTTLTPSSPPTYNFSTGTSMVYYVLEDIHGNVDTCSFSVEVVDNEPPVAVCSPTVILINPAGTVFDTLSPLDVGAMSTDNCGIDSMYVTPNVFSCDIIDAVVSVQLVVIDESGNRDSCNTVIRVEGEVPEPTAYSSCDTLILNANPPIAQGNIIYTFRWFGPSGNPIGNDENLIIIDPFDFEDGFYCVEIEGITGCVTSGCVYVDLDIPPQPTITGPQQICWDTEPVDLSTTPPQGVTGVTEYHWFAGAFPGGTLLQSTTIPSYSISPPHMVDPNTVTEMCFYVIVSVNGCESQPSNIVCVDIIRPPEPAVCDTVINICEGEILELCTPITGHGISYDWEGPGGNVPDVRNPIVTDSVNFALHDGRFELIIIKDGCPTATPASVIVNVLKKPDNRPSISSPDGLTRCEGQEHTFVTDLLGMQSYHWVGPGGRQTTTTPSLTFTTSLMDLGEWYVYGETPDGCRSDDSPIITLNVESFPGQAIAAVNPNPVCEGNDIQLSVTPVLTNASYFWLNPNTDTIGVAPNVNLQNIRQDDAGVYRAIIITNAGCLREAQVQVNVSAGVEVLDVSNDAPNCFNNPTDVHLSCLENPPNDGNYTYHWTGPCGLDIVTPDCNVTIPNATSDCNGVYTLVVTTGDGCMTFPATTLVDGLGPFLTPSISKNPNEINFCEGEPLVLNTDAYNGDSVTYIWSTPFGDTSTITPSFIINSLSIAKHKGNFSVKVNIDNCLTDPSGETVVNVNPVPVAMPEANEPCAGDEIYLFGNYAPIGGNTTFEWGTPRGLYGVQNPVIPNANPDTDNGTYIFTVERDGCTSLPASVVVNVKPALSEPIPLPADPVCIGSGDTLFLCVSASTVSQGGTFLWENEFGDTIGLTDMPCLAVTDFSRYTNENNNPYHFFVTVIVDDCDFKNTAPIAVQFNQMPTNNANAGQNKNICENEQVFLSAMPPDTGDGNWSFLGGIPGIEITNEGQPTTAVTGLPPGSTYQFQWSLSYGACEDYDRDTTSITVFEIENADAGPDIDTCEALTIRLNAVPSLSGFGEWTQEDVQEQLGVEIINPEDPNTIVRFPTPGVYKFTWVIPDSICGGDSDFMLVINSKGNPFAGDNFEDCGDGCTDLNAKVDQNGIWTSPDDGIEFIEDFEPNAIACGLKEGLNILIWTIDGGVCGDQSHDTVLVDYTYAPIAEDDDVLVPYGGNVEIGVHLNDQYSDDFTITVITEPLHGILLNNGGGLLEYTAELNFVGEDFAVYELCTINPECDCSQATVHFVVGGEIDRCQPPSIITPNGDNKNEIFSIPCLAQQGKYPNNELIIFNQWGDEVFRQSPYKNNWSGTFSGQDLPGGTYFYILDLGTEDKPLTGYLVIQR